MEGFKKKGDRMKQHRQQRSAGILLHPTSLPSPYGIGDFGSAAYRWLDWLQKAKQSWWQILPLGPTGLGDSPYQSFSAFAGNVNLISPEMMLQDNLLTKEEIVEPGFPANFVDYDRVTDWKRQLFRHAWDRLRSGQLVQLQEAFQLFCSEEKYWLEDYALFMSLKNARRGQNWYNWPRELIRREGDNKVIEFAAKELSDEVGYYQFGQFLFYRQWHKIREYARQRNIKIIGDIPIFVSGDSADIWANPKLFLLDGTLRPKAVAGVPPDYFSPTGQLWGNPHYDWAAMKTNGYRWWIDRIRSTLRQVDLIRLDHFRGFFGAWHVPPNDTTAVNGHWVEGPGKEFFYHLQKELGSLPLIAEDLGEISDDVYEGRDELGLPGMKVLQFAFDNPRNPFLPHEYQQNAVVYTGTHDNDTTQSWYHQLPEFQRHYLHRYLSSDGHEISWKLIRLAWSSVADYAIAPLQDVLSLGNDARMNLPGTATGNWRWRYQEHQLEGWMADRLAEWTELYARIPGPSQ